MFLQELSSDTSYSLLTVIVNRGKGSKVLQFINKLGVTRASCLLGKGTVKNPTLKLIEMDEVNKEIILIIVRSERESEILQQLKDKFHMDRPNHGIAFTMALAGILKVNNGQSLVWRNSQNGITQYQDSKYVMAFLIVNKGKAEETIELCQNAGFYGGTIIKARGTASELNIIFDMIVEPEKEAILMVTERNKMPELARLLNEELKLQENNTGILAIVDINQTIGLFENV